MPLRAVGWHSRRAALVSPATCESYTLSCILSNVSCTRSIVTKRVSYRTRRRGRQVRQGARLGCAGPRSSDFRACTAWCFQAEWCFRHCLVWSNFFCGAVCVGCVWANGLLQGVLWWCSRRSSGFAVVFRPGLSASAPNPSPEVEHLRVRDGA